MKPEQIKHTRGGCVFDKYSSRRMSIAGNAVAEAGIHVATTTDENQSRPRQKEKKEHKAAGKL